MEDVTYSIRSKGSKNQRHSQNISHVNVHVSLMVGNVTRDKSGTMISANVSLKNQ